MDKFHIQSLAIACIDFGLVERLRLQRAVRPAIAEKVQMNVLNDLTR